MLETGIRGQWFDPSLGTASEELGEWSWPWDIVTFHYINIVFICSFTRSYTMVAHDRRMSKFDNRHMLSSNMLYIVRLHKPWGENKPQALNPLILLLRRPIR